MVSALHELAHRMFARWFEEKLLLMGIREELEATGELTCQVPGGGGQPDSSYKPWPLRALDDDWPTLIIEAGVSQKIADLQEDAIWWLESSREAVSTVILIFASRPEKQLLLQKWEMAEIPNPQRTRGRPWVVEDIVPMSIEDMEIIGGVITGDEAKKKITIDFKKTLLRDPERLNGESDCVFTCEDLRDIARRLWRNTLPSGGQNGRAGVDL
ncbi:hypothetical protein B9Z19DRAFT_1121904 [Tuber borchii]|uniref:Uncharacterized protein n=1 Tax=Tuber borchii TaxID=42251 RepID=A0A2T7A1J1_TUBBO|nr:hypothetical protein B9Z19DRAFT_1121904 [Tuber borchii]